MRKLLLLLVVSVCAVPGTAWACESDDDCEPPTPICAFECVECLISADCTSTRPRCNLAGGSCEACTSDADCVDYPSIPVCTASGACGECSAGNTTLCGGTEPVCDTASGTCAACSSNADCSSSPDGDVCLATGACGDDAASCGSAPASVCGQAHGSFLRFTRGTNPADSVLLWKWGYGSIAPEEFGDPVFSTDFALCMYRDDTPIYGAQIEPSASFWTPNLTGYRFRYPLGNPDGILKMSLRSGNDEARIAVKGKGSNLDLPGLPINGEILVIQLVGNAASGSPCWGAEYVVPYRTDDGISFKDRSLPQ